MTPSVTSSEIPVSHPISSNTMPRTIIFGTPSMDAPVTGHASPIPARTRLKPAGERGRDLRLGELVVEPQADDAPLPRRQLRDDLTEDHLRLGELVTVVLLRH